jgi:HEAT repeat protein
MALFGPPNVEKLKARKDIKGLIKALSYEKDPGVRRAAAEALADLKDDQAIEPLSALLEDENDDVRQAAISALVEIGDARAVEPLSARLKDKNDDLQQAAISALVEIGDARAVEPLIATLKDTNGEVRRAAAWALGEIGDARAVDSLITVLDDEHQALRQARENVERLKNQDPNGSPNGFSSDIEFDAMFPATHQTVCEAAIQALGKIGDVRAVEALLSAHEDNDLRASTTRALGKLEDVRAAEAVVSAARDRHFTYPTEAFLSAAKILVRGGDSRAVEPLIAALEADSLGVRVAAAEGLGQIGDKRAVEPLIALLGDKEVKIRQASVRALGQIGDGRAVEPILNTIAQREDVVDALVQIGRRDAEPLVSALIYGELPQKRIIVDVLDKLDWKPDKDEAGASYWATKGHPSLCVQIGEPAVGPLIEALDSNNPYFVTGTVEALAKLAQTQGLEQAAEPLIPKLQAIEKKKRLTSTDEATRLAIIKALGDIGRQRAVAPLIDYVGHSETSVRQAAAEALLKLYKTGRLDDEHKLMILAQEKTMAQMHTDTRSHTDISQEGTRECDNHFDSTVHTDQGIGVSL